MIDITRQIHIVQTPDWGNFKQKMGTPAIKVGQIQFTKHKIPLLPFYVAYAPRVNFLAQKFSWSELKEAARQEKCIVVRFDVPNVLKEQFDNNPSEEIFSKIKSRCKIAPRSTFAKWNVLLDISPELDVLLENLHPKTRYNIKLAAKKGVQVVAENNETGIEIFNSLIKETARRQGFSPHPPEYYKKAFEMLHAKGKANILVAYYEKEPLAAWLLFNDGKYFYYPYGASSEQHKNLMASSLLAWEAIRLGKRLGCEMFDMWGATSDINSKWWGFTQFKLRYGGQLVEYIDSYDFVVNPLIYNAFNLAYNTFWKIKKRLGR